MGRTAERWQPPRFVDEELDEDRLREGLVAQHTRLRAVLGRLDARARAVIRTGASSPAALARAFDGVAATLADHTRCEERALARLLPRSAAAARALARLREDHRRQHAELDAMARLAAGADDGITFALSVRAFVSDVLLDMDTEDRRYLSGRPLEGEPADGA
jgi:hypothetical protein